MVLALGRGEAQIGSAEELIVFRGAPDGGAGLRYAGCMGEVLNSDARNGGCLRVGG